MVGVARLKHILKRRNTHESHVFATGCCGIADCSRQDYHYLFRGSRFLVLDKVFHFEAKIPGGSFTDTLFVHSRVGKMLYLPNISARFNSPTRYDRINKIL